VVSGKGPGANEADDLFSDQVINGFVGGMNHALEASGVDGRATIKVVRDDSFRRRISWQSVS